jgi:hypothetical protein
MSKCAASLSIVIIGALGCRNVPPMEGKETHTTACSTATPTSPAQQPHLEVGPEVVPARKTLAIAIEAPKSPPSNDSPAKEFAPTSVSVSPKNVMGNPSDNPAKAQETDVEDMAKPRAESRRTDDMDGPMSASQARRTLRNDLPRDVWYILATLVGAVFTYILAPVVVEIIKVRIARHHLQVPSVDGSMTYPHTNP